MIVRSRLSTKKNNLDIKYTPYSGVGWVATDGKGYKFYFTTSESAQNYYLSTGTEYTAINGINGLNYDINSSPITAWYLDSIVSPTSEIIKFEYVKGKSLSVVSKSETYLQFDKLLTPNCVGDFPNSVHTYDASRQEITDVYLRRIVFQNGSLEFSTSTRNDVEYISSPNGFLAPSKLDSVTLKNVQGERLKKFIFSYSYFDATNPNSRYLRLKLDSITEYGRGQSKKPSYVFSYINPNVLPDKYSKGVDNWGFFNGRNNSTLLPTPDYSSISFEGGDKSADTTSLFAINGTLSRIQYPTGGYTDFEYELHDYSNLRHHQKYTFNNRYAFVRANPSVNPQGDQTECYFTVKPGIEHPNDPIPVTFSCSYQKVDPNATDGPVLGYSNVYKINSNGTTTPVADCSTANYGEPNPSPTNFIRNLAPGNYRINLLSSYGWSRFMSASWKEDSLIQSDERIGGGIRVKSIADVNSAGNKVYKKFSYLNSDGKSSGILLDYPAYSVIFEVERFAFTPPVGEIPGFTCTFQAIFSQIYSQSFYPSGLSSGTGNVGYSRVTVSQGENAQNGRTEHYFHNQAGLIDSFPGVSLINDPINGELDSVITINLAGDYLKKEIFQYQNMQIDTLPAIKLFVSQPQQSANGMDPEPYYAKFYNNYSNWVVNTGRTEITFSGTNQLIENTVNYFENSEHREITRTERWRSDGSKITIKFKRPGEYAVSGGASPVEQMRNRHVITPVIEQQTLLQKGSVKTLLSGNFAAYKTFSPTVCKPNIIYDIETAVPLSDTTASSYGSTGQPILQSNYAPHVYINQYDAYGNVLEQQKANDIREVYLWGYNNQYCVAKVMGSDYASVSGIITQAQIDAATGSDVQMRSVLNALRNALPNALVTYYTYAPLVGMTSETDQAGKTIYYEYDEFNRLSLIRDQYGNILEAICYNYAGQQENCQGVITYANEAKSGSFTRNNCAAGAVSSSVTYIVPSGTYTSNISLAATNQLAQNDVNANGQGYANLNGVCTFKNVIKSQPFTRNNCPAGGIPATVNYTVPAGTYSSTVSQAAADQLAQNDINANGQNYANTTATCTFKNVEKSNTFIKMDCPPGTYGSSVTYVVPANTYSSTVSQATVDQLAQNDVNTNGPTYANTHGTCITPPCAFVMSSGYSNATNSITSSGSTVSFYLVFYSTASTISAGINYTITTINGVCRPSVNRTFTATGGGRTWQVTITTTGSMTVQITSGTSIGIGISGYISGSYNL